MSQLVFNGPVDVTPELMMAMWEAMPETGKSGVAQLFFSRFVSGPIADAALTAGARVIFEKFKIRESATKKLREAVFAKCQTLAEGMNEKTAQTIIQEECAKAATTVAQVKMGEVLERIPAETLLAAAIKPIEDAVRGLANKYFSQTQEGQNWILNLIRKVKDEQESGLKDVVRDRLFPAVDRGLPSDNGALTAGTVHP